MTGVGSSGGGGGGGGKTRGRRVRREVDIQRERQVEKEDADDLRAQVDSEFAAVRHLLSSAPRPARTGKDDAASDDDDDDDEDETETQKDDKDPREGAAKRRRSAPGAVAVPDAEGDAAGGEDAYDRMVSALARERKAKPTDRLKTPEELARDQRRRLEALEVRLAPMSL
jgi:nucleolar protein 14